MLVAATSTKDNINFLLQLQGRKVQGNSTNLVK